MKPSLQVRIAALLLSCPAVAQAQTSERCLTETDIRALSQFALPMAVSHITDACRASLPADAFLLRAKGDLLARYTPFAERSKAMALVTMGKMAGLSMKQMAHLPVSTFLTELDKKASAAATKIKPDSCGVIDNVVEQLAPLPPQNMAALIGIAIRESARKNPGGPFSLCPVTQEP